jgi:hypothetical protein
LEGDVKTDQEIGKAIIVTFEHAFRNADLQAAVGLFGLSDEETITRVCCAVATAARRELS